MKLYYFDMYGRAEPARMLLDHAKVPFEDVRFKREEWPDKKASFEFGTVPVLEKDGKQYCQSKSIMKYLGRTYGYYSEDPEVAYKIDSAVDGMDDLTNSYMKVRYAGEDKEAQAKAFADFMAYFDVWLGIYEKRLAANTTQKYFVGDKLTIVDFEMVALAYSFFMNDANEGGKMMKPVAEKHEVFFKYILGLGEEFKEYLAKRPQPRAM